MGISRRRFIANLGLAGSAGLLSSIAGELWVRAESPAKLERRFVTIVDHMGWWARLLRPTNLEQPSEAWELPESLAPLQDRRDQLTILEGLYNPHGSGLHGTYGAVLNAMPSPTSDKRSIGGVSIDRFIATELSADVPISSLNFGYPYGGNNTTVGNASSDGPQAPYPAMTSPLEVIAQVFGGIDGGDAAEQRAELERLVAQRKSVLDSSVDDIERMRTRLAAGERAQMDQYLDSLRQLEGQLDGLLTVECTAPAWEGPDVPAGQNTMRPDLFAFFYEASAIALECGLTRVVTIASPGVGGEPGTPRHPFEPPNVPQAMHDAIMHPMLGLENDGTDASWLDREEHVAKIRRIYNWRAQLVSNFVDRLEQTDLGGYTTADRTLITWLNAGGGQHHFGSDNIPLIFVGNPDGVLNTGRYERFEPQTRCISDAFTTAARAMGMDVDGFGDPEHSQGVLPGALA